MSKCRLCNKKADFLHSLIGDRTSSKISLYFCKSCNAYYTYPQEYDYHQSDSSIIEYYLNHQEYIEWRHNKIFSFVENTFRVKNNSFLDIGSGLGLSLSVASARGWSSLGVEPCHILAKYSKEHLNLNVLEGFFSPEIQEKIKLNTQSKFDFILVDNVLEHVSEPVKFIRDSLTLLGEDGVLLVIIPPVDWLRVFLTKFSRVRNQIKSAQLNLFYDPEQHINYFSRKAIRKLVEVELRHHLLDARFHHSKLLDNKLSQYMKFETGYFFITKNN